MKIHALTAPTNAPHRCGPARRRIAPVLVLMAAMVASTGLSACRWRPPAATINGQEISAEELQADLRVLRENPGLANALVGGPGAIGGPELNDGVVPAQVTGAVLTYRIIERLVIDAGNASSSRPDDQTFQTNKQAAYERLVALLDATVDPNAGSAAALVKEPDAHTKRLLDRRSIFEVHGAALLDGLDDQQRGELVARVLGGGVVTIDPRFGSWNPEAPEVVLPSHTPADQAVLAS